MKSNRTMRIGVIVLALTLITACLAGGTLAKYATTVGSADSTGTVAKWSWEINDVAAAENWAFNLFNTVKEADTTTTETDVDTGKIAPGTGGSFEIKIDNLSEVNGTYTLTFTETNASGIPIEYSIDGTTWKTAIADINVAATAIAMKTGTATKTVYWRWAFEGNDTTDTALGTAGTAPTVTVSVSAAFTQVD